MASDLTFKVTRKNPQLIPPAKPTPHVFKPLSDIDDQEGLRFQIPIIQFYPKNPSMEGKDPVKIIHDAIAKALVFYYPFAGRLREAAARKLIVECTGEGVMFIEADADITLKEFGDNLQPPFPCLDELLYDVPGSGEVLNCPLLLIQYQNSAKGGVGAIPGVASFYIPLKNSKGENGIVVPICLPAAAMEVFVKELEMMLKKEDDTLQKSVFIMSAL